QIANCGRAFPGHDVEIVDDGGAALGERQVGHILLRGPSVAKGYFEDEAATASAWSGGWLRTGDLGYLAGGDLHVCGRAKDLIIVHGRNYHPQDIEWEASQTQNGRQGNVVAFGVEDAAAGRERVIIAAETKLAGVGREQLQHSIRSRLMEALALAVDEVLLLPPHSLPKTSSGKLQRALARDLFLAGKLGEP
ncbi:MAG: AMP-dependent synthetase, partial [Ramlibacter sp.]